MELERIGRDVYGQQAVGLYEQFLAWEPPVRIAVGDVVRRRDKAIHELELRLDEPLSHVERLLRDLGEALVTAARRFLRTELVGARSHHLAVPMTDRDVLVE